MRNVAALQRNEVVTGNSTQAEIDRLSDEVRQLKRQLAEANAELEAYRKQPKRPVAMTNAERVRRHRERLKAAH